jgi:hypothetical protein
MQRTGTIAVSSPYGNVLVADQRAFRADEEVQRARAWLAARWGARAEDIYVVVVDDSPECDSVEWRRVIGLLEVTSLSSARIFILDTLHRQGRSDADAEARRGTPHEGNIFLITEYRPPGELEKALAARFYSTKLFWYGRPLGGLAIVEDVCWKDLASRSGYLEAYQSQKVLPSLTVTIDRGSPRKWSANVTGIIDPYPPRSCQTLSD